MKTAEDFVKTIKTASGINYVEVDGRNYAVLKRKNGKRECDDPCPFCGEQHIHGIAPGHRVAHCIERKKITLSDGIELNREDGYYVVNI